MNKKKRPSKEEYYLEIAKSVARRSPCIRRKFGAIVVKEDAVVSTGYNGPARGVINCIQAGCLKDELDVPSYEGYDYCPAVHAEENAVINAARQGARVLGGTLYLSGLNSKSEEIIAGKPCDRCKRTIINAGIEKVVTKNTEETIVKDDVSSWVSQDTENYLNRLEEAQS